MKPNLDCTIILLSYNSQAVTDECLTRVEKAIDYCKKNLNNHIKVTVVDNASHDGSTDMIRKKHKFVNLIALDKNIGYAAGNNLALKKVDTPYILLMNSDTYIEKDAIFNAIKFLTSNENCDVAVCRTKYDNGELQKYGGYLPTPFKLILWSFGFESLPVIKRFIHKIYTFNNEFYDKVGIMQWGSPNFMLLKKEVYDATKGFDENLWFHMVDAEWCQRIHKNSFAIYYTPGYEVIHLGGASSKGLETKLIHDNFKGLMYFIKKHYPGSLWYVKNILRTGLKMRSALFNIMGKKELAATYSEISLGIK